MKFIYQQLPASEVIHTKINSVSNEKRGRTDLFSILGYLKRLRDVVNYKVVGEQKNNAWSIDTVVKGSQADLKAYVDSQKALGTIPNAASEFVHTEAVQRQYLSNTLGGGGTSDTYALLLSAMAAGTGFPISYWNTHLTGASTRASAVVSTEPVARMIERRQNVYAHFIKKLGVYVCESLGIQATKDDFVITFPEIISNDRSTKLKDLQLAQSEKWLSHKRVAELASGEFEVHEYKYDEEQKLISSEPDDIKNIGMSPNPLSAPPEETKSSMGGLDQGEKSKVKDTTL